MPIISAVIVFISCVFIIWAATEQLKHKHGKDIRIVWYGFWLSFVVTFEISLWAVGYGAINTQGSFEGSLGQLLRTIMGHLLDLNADVAVILGIVSIITLPQFFSYVLSGLSGCASRPLYIGESWTFLIWFLVKSFAGCGGIILAVASYSMYRGWSTFTAGVALIDTAAMLITLALIVLHLYRDSSTLPTDFQTKFPKAAAVFSSAHKNFTKYSSNS